MAAVAGILFTEAAGIEGASKWWIADRAKDYGAPLLPLIATTVRAEAHVKTMHGAEGALIPAICFKAASSAATSSRKLPAVTAAADGPQALEPTATRPLLAAVCCHAWRAPIYLPAVLPLP